MCEVCEVCVMCEGCEEGIQRTREISNRMLPRAGMEWRTVDMIICKFFKNLHTPGSAKVTVQQDKSFSCR